jgi:hypothetical protein
MTIIRPSICGQAPSKTMRPFVFVEAPEDEAMDECARLRRTNGVSC